jgi:beta-ketoacyl-acyl-carrier-protein synthase II
MMRSGRSRVVITGLGAITPLAHSVAETWQGLLAGRSGVGPITQFDASDLPCRIAAEVKDFRPEEYIDYKDARRMSRAAQLAVAAAQEAVEDAGLANPFTYPERVGVLIGTGIGGFEKGSEGMEAYRDRGLRGVGPFTLISALANMPSYYVGSLFGALGPLNTVVAACATGTQSIGEAAEWIRRGSADVVITGGVEGLIHPGSIAGFAAMRALSQMNDEPKRASRPFDKDRDGFVVGEAAGIVVLERLEVALARGARIYAEVLGQSSCADAFHPAAPHPEGKGAIRAMRWALDDAGLTPDAVDYVNAHGSSTPLNDSTETLAIKEVFGGHAYELMVSSTKSMLGHLMGAAGAVEAMACILSLRDGIVHPTINYETPDPECDLDYVPNEARNADVEVTLSNSFGLGGQNACLVLGKYRE